MRKRSSTIHAKNENEYKEVFIILLDHEPKTLLKEKNFKIQVLHTNFPER